VLPPPSRTLARRAPLRGLRPLRCARASAAPAATGRPWPSSFGAVVLSSPLGSCLAVAGTRSARAVATRQFTRTRCASARSLAAMLHNAPLCAVRLARPLYLYTKPFAYGRASQPVRAARRTTRTMQNGRRCAPCTSSVRGSRPRRCQHPARCASARRPWLARCPALLLAARP
jgi:hypothetical protein